MEALLPHLGPALMLLRKQVGMKQKDLAARAGVTRPMLSAYETGRQLPALVTFDRLLGALDADFADLQSAINAVTPLPRPDSPPVLPQPEAEEEPVAPWVASGGLSDAQMFRLFRKHFRAWQRDMLREVLRSQQRCSEDVEPSTKNTECGRLSASR